MNCENCNKQYRCPEYLTGGKCCIIPAFEIEEPPTELTLQAILAGRRILNEVIKPIYYD